jgi:hypothetical protein
LENQKNAIRTKEHLTHKSRKGVQPIEMTPTDNIWQGIRKWRDEKVQYEKIEIEPYNITANDLTEDVIGQSLSKCDNFVNQHIDNNMDEMKKSEINVLVHYQEVFDTGEKFLRVATRQWTDGV